MQKATRLKRELEKITQNPPAGISCCPREENLMSMDASIIGVAGTPYEAGVFKLEILITDRYPFEPPRLRFLTPVYHPNIDNNGRICHDLLKLPPSGAWRPTVTIEGILLALQMLLANPNPDDPLMDDIANEYRLNKQEFEKKARDCTRKFANQCSARGSEDPSKDTSQKRKLSNEEDTKTPPAKQFKNSVSSDDIRK